MFGSFPVGRLSCRTELHRLLQIKITGAEQVQERVNRSRASSSRRWVNPSDWTRNVCRVRVLTCSVSWMQVLEVLVSLCVSVTLSAVSSSICIPAGGAAPWCRCHPPLNIQHLLQRLQDFTQALVVRVTFTFTNIIFEHNIFNFTHTIYSTEFIYIKL